MALTDAVFVCVCVCIGGGGEEARYSENNESNFFCNSLNLIS